MSLHSEYRPSGRSEKSSAISHSSSVDTPEVGRNKSLSDGTTTRKTTEQISLLKPGRSLVAKAPTNLLARKFLANVETADKNGCRNWRGAIREDGYGRLKFRGHERLAHRVAWTLFRGPISDEMEIDHRCFNRRCVAAEHLEPVTKEENFRRAQAAGRMLGPHERTVGITPLNYCGAPITQRQISILQMIAAEIVKRGRPPSIREIGAQFGIRSTNGTNDHLKALERKGLIVRDEMKARSIELTAQAFVALGLCVDQHRCLTCGQSLPQNTERPRSSNPATSPARGVE